MAGERWAAITEETVYGTKDTVADLDLSYIDMDLSPNQNKILLEESDNRMKTGSVMGPFNGDGPFEIYARPDTIGWFLKWAWGGHAAAVEGGATYKHTFTLGQSINSFTLQDIREIAGTKARVMTGTLVKELTLEAPARDVFTAKMELQYKSEELDTAPSIGTLSSLRPFVFHDASITDFDGSALGDVESIRLTIRNGIPDDHHELGARTLQSIELENYEIVGEMDLKWKSWAMRQKYYGALVAAAEPTTIQDEERTFNLEVTSSGAETGETESGAEYYKFIATLPAIVLTENPAQSRTRERLRQRVSFEALKNTGNKLELWNLDTTY